MAFNVPEVLDFIENHVASGSVLVDAIMTFAEQVRSELTSLHRNAYSRTIVNVLDDWMDPEFSNAPRSSGHAQGGQDR